MDLEIIRVGELRTNCYVLSKNNKAIVIDPGDEAHKIIKYLEDNNLELVAILITHSHFDHVGGLYDLLNHENVKVFNNDNIEEKNYKIEDFSFDVIKTYGHTNDSVCYYFEEDNIMFVGDFIFKNSIGRTDLGGNYNDMMNSIKKIKGYRDDITIYPGHGESSILGLEKRNNPYFT